MGIIFYIKMDLMEPRYIKKMLMILLLEKLSHETKDISEHIPQMENILYI
jgi:hypothetical protein